MKRLYLLFLIVLLLPGLYNFANAQSFTMGSRDVALGQAVTALPDDQWAPFHNPALMPEQNHASFFGIRYFGFSELTDMAVSSSYNSNIGTFGVGMFTYGDDRFRESQYRVAYAEELYNIRMGASVNLYHMSFTGRFGSALAPTLDLGVAVDITEELLLGARTSNLTRTTIGADEEDLPADLAIGLSYLLMDQALFVTELYKDVDHDLSFRTGLEVELVDILYLRGGLTHDHPQTFTFGVGVIQDRWKANVAVEQHQQLGMSPGIDFSILW